MFTRDDAINTLEFKKYFVILPSSPLWNIDKFRLTSSQKPGKFCLNNFEYNSGENQNFLSIVELKKLIAKLY